MSGGSDDGPKRAVVGVGVVGDSGRGGEGRRSTLRQPRRWSGVGWLGGHCGHESAAASGW